ncbi:MAG: hypothetical protein ACYC5Y_10360 [Symbiobacteriia bacterium]
MASIREISTKPTFWNELHSLPRRVLLVVTEKVACVHQSKM